ncbi:asparagine synthase-related protein [Roseibium aestuarii]|uniref:Asparagine synthase-related protein n=1 Tax=Roseibium aestuarii TaxID=2600299 RepID=A0ABW4JS56_9HYPH|nr:asparagine synthase-related protein [Roseibium aestuarii]
MSRIPLCTLAFCFHGEAPETEKARLISNGVDAIAALGAEQIYRIDVADDAILLTNYPRSNIASGDCQERTSWVLLHNHLALSTDGRALGANDLVKGLSSYGVAFLDDFEPPFLAFAAKDGEIVACPDRLGLAHLFAHAHAHGAVLCTQSSVLSRVFSLPYDPAGLLTFMTAGHRIGNRSTISGVTMVRQGFRARLRGGEIVEEPLSIPYIDLPDDPVEAGCEAIRRSVARCLDAAPSAGMELSGGLDSRMILAAIPQASRVGMLAHTIGYAPSPDITTAGQIASLFDMDHDVLDLSSFGLEQPDQIWARASRVALRDDFTSNIHDRLTIDCVDDHLLGATRLGGVNGEYARGFYYPALPIDKPVSEDAIDRLISWRLMTNDAAPKSLFADDLGSRIGATLRESVKEALATGDEPFGQALDTFYLNQRMRQWAGNSLTRAMSNRMILAPFFHREYLAWAKGLPVAAKRDSKLFCDVLTRLDGQLGHLPLDTGLIPAHRSSSGVSARLSDWRHKAGKLSTKLRQRFAGARKLNLGGESFQSKLAKREILERINWDQLAQTGVLDPAFLDQMRQSKVPAGRTTLGYLLPMHFHLGYLTPTPGSARAVTLQASREEITQ